MSSFFSFQQALEQDNYVQNIETLIFALAMCATQRENKKMCAAAYNSVPMVCKEPQHFILFIKFCNQLNKENDSKKGYGQGWRKSVMKWYNSKTPLELAKSVTLCKGRYGWKHKDIIKLAHYHSQVPAVNFIIQYLLKDMSEAKEFSKKITEDISEVVAYIENIERFKHCEDQFEAGRLVEIHNFVLDHVPAHLLKSEEVG